mgnify:CR=1 FL=1
MPHHGNWTRRAFLERAGLLGTATSALPWALQLAAMGDAAAFSATDYKALVCVFMAGGNDSANTIVPYDLGNYDQYHRIRGGGPGRSAGGVALGHSDLSATVLTPTSRRADGLEFALHPRMTQLRNVFDQGHASVLFNVGPLVVPTTRTQYQQGAVPLPPKLFSHNDQQSIWQSESAEGSTIGWGGRIADMALASNSKAHFTCISTMGNAVFLAGQQAAQYQITPNGAIPLLAFKYGTFFNIAARDQIRALLGQTKVDPFEADYLRTINRASNYEGEIEAALNGNFLNTPFPAGTAQSLGAQLQIVARLIKARQALGVKRQVFFVQRGGFDLHSSLASQQPNQLQDVSDALAAFYAATVELGVAQGVTAFTASDFGRTLTYNGDGTDHGWGAHHFVVGGAIKGGKFLGTPPPISVGDTTAPDDQWHVGQGRWLPTTSLAQFGGSLARWFGATEDEALAIFPNLVNFGGDGYPRDLGMFS